MSEQYGNTWFLVEMIASCFIFASVKIAVITMCILKTEDASDWTDGRTDFVDFMINTELSLFISLLRQTALSKGGT